MSHASAPETVIRQLELCGLPAFHVQRPGLTRLTLHVGVGWADETFATRGVTHVIEHLAMSAAKAGKFEVNASVGAFQTGFWAHGRPEQVAAFLNDVARALHGLPMDRLEKEKGVLDAESSAGGYGAHDAALKMRYGNRGLGLGLFPGLGPQAADPAVVEEHLRTWFVRGNAAITVLGDIPDGLELALPEGPTPVRTHEETARPGSVSFDVAGPVLSFVAPDVPEASFALRAMAKRMEDDLRHERGLVYAVGPELIRLPGSPRVLFQLAAQVAPGAAKEVAEAMAAEMVRRSEVGASPEEIADDLEWWDAAADHPDGVLLDLDVAVERLLAGRPFRSEAESRALVEALEPATVAAVVRDALDTVLLLTPQGEDPETTFPDGGACSVRKDLTTTPLRRRFRSPAARGTALGFGTDVVQHQDEDGDVHEVRFDECVGVGVAEGARLLFGARGCFVWVDPREYRGAADVVRAIDERIPSGLHFDMKTSPIFA